MNENNHNFDRLPDTFSSCKAQNRAALITFISAGDPDIKTSQEIINALPDAGADIIELGMPFSDPMADGPAIQASSQRALKAGINLQKILNLVTNFREDNKKTPIILMGYYNPIYIYGVERFIEDAKQAGIDGLLIVDLPPEEDRELCQPATQQKLHFIRLATPTTSETRLKKILYHASGFLYYVSIAGITGAKAATTEAVSKAVGNIRQQTQLPIAVGFGIKTPQDAENFSQCADGVIVGSALVETIRTSLDENGKATQNTIPHSIEFVRSLRAAIQKNTILQDA